MKSKTGLYWSGKGRLFRKHKTDADTHSCPKCKSVMVKRISDIDLMGDRKYVWVCSNPACLFVVSSNKIANLDLQKVKKDLGARANSTLYAMTDENNILHITDSDKNIYVNASGEIWTSGSDKFYKTVSNASNAVQEVRKLMASSRISFEILAEDVLKNGDPVLAEPVFEDSPEQVVIIEVGDEIISDLMNEPEVEELCPEDQDEVAVMVFDEILADKNSSYLKKMSKKSCDFLNEIFENMKFTAIGNKIKVSFDAKLASSNLSKKEFQDFLFSTVKDSDLYSKLSTVANEERSKTASELPNFFRIREVILKEIKEQL